MAQSRKMILLKIGALILSFSLMVFYIFHPNVTAMFQGSKATFKDGRKFQELQDKGSYDDSDSFIPKSNDSENKANETEVTLLLSIHLDEKEEGALKEGKFPKLSEEDQKKFEEKIGKWQENIKVEYKKKDYWGLTLEGNIFILKKVNHELHFYRVPSEEPSSDIQNKK